MTTDDSREPPRRAGPIDVGLWASQLTARVVEAGAAPRIFGYDVQADLAPHYSFGEVVLLCLSGEVPSREVGRAFEIALSFLAPVSVAEAPAHAAGLAHLLGADPSGVMAGAAIGLSERARHIVAQHAPLLAWLAAPDAGLPDGAKAVEGEPAEAVERLARALETIGVEIPLLARRPTLIAGLLAVLHRCGLRRPAQLEAALCMAAWPAVVAEAFAVPPYAFFNYPMNLPAYRYTEEPKDG
ncbi:MAG: hypothetical protein ACRENE_33315 [Polyangiaceae bacterium]